MANLLIEKLLNNNVIIAEHPSYKEVVLIGKGIGFGRKPGEYIDTEKVEKLFVLKNEEVQENYLQLMPLINNDFLEAIISAIEHIKQRTNSELDEHIHVALTDHIMFALSRSSQGAVLSNPFLMETKALYRFEFEIALEVVELLKEKTGILLPAGEIGFIAMHIHSAITNKNISDINQHSQLVSRLVEIVEEQFQIEIDKESLEYKRLVRHLHYAIERVVRGEKLEEPKKIDSLLKEEYPVCYSLSWKLIKVMQQALKQEVYEAEAVYLTLHLQRLQNKFK